MAILIVDDEQAIRDLLVFNLQKAGYQTKEAADGIEALTQVHSGDIELILLDLMLPQLDGLEVCRRLKAEPHTSRVPIIMLTAKVEEIDKVLGLELGADDYVTKPFSIRELLSRIKAVLRRSNVVSNDALENKLITGPLQIDFLAHRVMVDGHELYFTPKEFELLKILATNEGKAFSRDELLTTIWGYEYYGDTRTVDVHIRHVRAKLQPHSKLLADSIMTVHGKGYRFSMQIEK